MNMNPSSSKSTETHNKKCSRTEKATKKQPLPRNPLQDLNFSIATSSSNTATATSSNRTTVATSSSSSSSSEVPRGCLRFFLSHSSSSSSSSNAKSNFTNRHTKVKPFTKTPKSAPNTSKPLKRSVLQKPLAKKAEKVKKKPTPCLYQWQSEKEHTSKNASKSGDSSVLNATGFHDIKQPSASKLGIYTANDENLTPLSKMGTGPGFEIIAGKKAVNSAVSDDDRLSNTNGNTNKTPPIQASVSPEIQNTQCGSIAVNTAGTPSCYGAGHIVSGVTDKRKCRPRGILTVGENNVLDFGSAKAIDSFNSEDDGRGSMELSTSAVSLVPLPVEASMNWLLSPCDEEEGEDLKSENLKSVHSPCSGLLIDDDASDLCNFSNNKSSLISSPSDNNNVVISSSPTDYMPSSETTSAEEARNSFYDLDGQKSPLSLESRNVIQTPEWDPSSVRRVDLSWFKPEMSQKCPFESEIDQLTESLHMANLWSGDYESIWDPTSRRFQFDLRASPSNSVDLSKFQKVLDDRVSWMSTSTLDNVSQSQMRISWREGLVSRIFEMDECDSCRYLSSDEEEDERLMSCQNPELNFDLRNEDFLKNGFESITIEDTDLEIKIKSEERARSQILSSCAESISTDGGGLAASADSEWNLCYKNELFKA